MTTSAIAGELAKERDLFRVLLLAKRDADPSEGDLVIPNAPEVTLALLRAARSDVRSQSMGSRAVRRSPRLAWDGLVELYGDETTLEHRLEALKAAGLNSDDGLLELADKYLGGWRPKDFADDDDE